MLLRITSTRNFRYTADSDSLKEFGVSTVCKEGRTRFVKKSSQASPDSEVHLCLYQNWAEYFDVEFG